ncbi:ABC transporter substrate-binding protein [uncultured Mailhella sp.]|uniref:ABC transporter substrate-binding protein n=1 Tax=uncultured Mailhella sp. TaxID=1981031 RepID=UPI0025FC495A|nr:ABC transporter substrate-binding protein [uncultured Mailhella sp.]
MKAPLSLAAAALTLLVSTAQARVIVDMRGKAVTVPDNPASVATIDDGFIEGVMTHLGVINRVKVIGSWSMKRDYRYTIPSRSGESREYRGWNTMKYLHPWLDDLPCVNSPQGNIISYETLALAAPDVVLLRAGDTTVGTDKEKVQKTADTIEALGLPLLVLYSPTWFRSSDLSGMKTEAGIIGELFGQKEKAEALIDRLAETEDLIRRRTSSVSEEEKVSVLLLGLRPDVRKKGGAGSVHGRDTPESYIVEQIVHARNAFQGNGTGVPMSAEQVYACDPDVIILPTANGYHPPQELCEAPYYENLQELRAVKNGRVYALPWSPMNASRRVEYPLDMLIIAKAAYPERFADISVYDFALRFYQDIYGVSEETARGLRSTQLLDWMAESGF